MRIERECCVRGARVTADGVGGIVEDFHKCVVGRCGRIFSGMMFGAASCAVYPPIDRTRAQSQLSGMLARVGFDQISRHDCEERKMYLVKVSPRASEGYI